MKPSFREFEDKKTDKFNPAVFRRGVINKVYPETWTADVLLIGNTQGVIKNIPLSSAVPSSVQMGDKCRLDLFDETNPNDIVVSYVYGRKFKPAFSSGVATVTTGGITVSHGLGVVPDVVSLFIYPNSPYTTTGAPPTPITDEVFMYQATTSSSLFLKSVIGNLSVQWYAFVF